MYEGANNFTFLNVSNPFLPFIAMFFTFWEGETQLLLNLPSSPPNIFSFSAIFLSLIRALYWLKLNLSVLGDPYVLVWYFMGYVVGLYISLFFSPIMKPFCYKGRVVKSNLMGMIYLFVWYEVGLLMREMFGLSCSFR